uniref:NAD(P)-binding protein n=1 Tax=Mycena chlorophos TaxID=658473 RepID=A0ABQ0LT29_MYCCL|nr:predicted protein [Mycena chlorophos]
MPSLADAKAAVAAFPTPSYVPVAVFAGGTSGVGQAMAEALARQLHGRVHIILLGRNAAAAQRILDSFPKPTSASEDGEWKHEFVQCDANSMKNVETVCAELKTRLKRVNFLVMSAAGPRGNSFTESDVTEEGIDDHLSMRYFSRYLYVRELLPLVKAAEASGQHAHVMSVLGAGFGMGFSLKDPMLHQERARSWKFLQGLTPKFAAVKGMVRGVGYNDGLIAHVAAQNPSIAFTHIMPGQVWTAGAQTLDLGWLLAPLGWLLTLQRRIFLVIPQDDCAQYMLAALLSPDTERGGAFFTDMHGSVVGGHVFPADYDAQRDWRDEDTRTGYLQGVRVKGYGGSDKTVTELNKWTEEVLEGVLSGSAA